MVPRAVLETTASRLTASLEDRPNNLDMLTKKEKIQEHYRHRTQAVNACRVTVVGQFGFPQACAGRSERSHLRYV